MSVLRHRKLIRMARILATQAVSLRGTGRHGPSWEVMAEYRDTLNGLADALEAMLDKPIEPR